MESFGEILRRLRDECDSISLRELAKRAHLDPGHLSRLQTGKRAPTAEIAAILDEALNANGELRRAADNARPLDGAVLDGDQEARLIASATAPSRIDYPTVDSLAAVLAADRRIEDAIGSAPLILPVQARLAMLEPMVLEARGAVRSPLVGVAAQWAQFAGWLHAADRRPKDAAGWFDRATEWATEAGDVNLIACVLSFKGHLAWLTGHVGPMVGLSQAAQRDRGVYPGQLGFDCQQEARGHAMMGDRPAADRKLDEAAEHLDRASATAPEDRPPWMYYHVPAFHDLQRGLVYRFLGRTDPVANSEATELLTAGLANLPVEMRGAEWAAAYVYHRGVTHLQAGDPEQAAADVTEIVAIARRTASGEAEARAARLAGRLAETWPTVQAVVDLRSLLADR